MAEKLGPNPSLCVRAQVWDSSSQEQITKYSLSDCSSQLFWTVHQLHYFCEWSCDAAAVSESKRPICGHHWTNQRRCTLHFHCWDDHEDHCLWSSVLLSWQLWVFIKCFYFCFHLIACLRELVWCLSRHILNHNELFYHWYGLPLLPSIAVLGSWFHSILSANLVLGCFYWINFFFSQAHHLNLRANYSVCFVCFVCFDWSDSSIRSRFFGMPLSYLYGPYWTSFFLFSFFFGFILSSVFHNSATLDPA